jgi:hypothetical protein
LEVDIALGGNIDSVHPRYPDDIQVFQGNLELKENVFVHKALLPKGLDVLVGRRIAFLHVDLNAAQPEVDSLRLIFESVVPGGIVLLDDYCGRGREVQHNAINTLGQEMHFCVISLPTGQGLILKDHRFI